MDISYQKKRQTPKRKAAGSNPVQGASSEILCLARIPALRRGFLAGQGISSLPNRNRCAGLRFGVAASRQVLSYAKHIDFNRPSRVGAKPALFRRFLPPAGHGLAQSVPL